MLVSPLAGWREQTSLAERVEANGGVFLEAPVSGSKGQAAGVGELRSLQVTTREQRQDVETVLSLGGGRRCTAARRCCVRCCCYVLPCPPLGASCWT